MPSTEAVPRQPRLNTNLDVTPEVADFLQSSSHIAVLHQVDAGSANFNQVVFASILLEYVAKSTPSIVVIAPRLPELRRGLFTHLLAEFKKYGLLRASKKASFLKLKGGLRVFIQNDIANTCSDLGVLILCGLSTLPDMSQGLLFQQAQAACVRPGHPKGRLRLIGPSGATVERMLRRISTSVA